MLNLTEEMMVILMSMPTFPDGSTDITQEQAFNMILGSIAMEELALSHIMNAEAEKLQYILGTLPGSRGVCRTTRELLEVNQSITDLLENVMHNQLLLKGKLTRVLEAKKCLHPYPDPCCEPCPSPCCPEPCCAPCSECCECGGADRESCVYQGPKCFHWKSGCHIAWLPTRDCGSISRQCCTPSTIYPCRCGTYLVGYSFDLAISEKGKTIVAMQTVVNGKYQIIQLSEGCTESANDLLHLSGTAVLTPKIHCPPPPILFTLHSPSAVTAKQAILSLSLL